MDHEPDWPANFLTTFRGRRSHSGKGDDAGVRTAADPARRSSSLFTYALLLQAIGARSVLGLLNLVHGTFAKRSTDLVAP